MSDQFKTFVHSYLDQHGIAHGDPENQHQKEGCRIGARLDLMFAQIDQLKREKDTITASWKQVVEIGVGQRDKITALKNALREAKEALEQ